MQYNFIQTFKINSTKVNDSSKVFITSVEIFFKEKPQQVNNSSGILTPGVSVHICPVSQDTPDPEIILDDEVASVDYESVSALSDASTGTRFYFDTPIIIETNKQYGIVIRFEDEGYVLWEAVQDQFILGTTLKYSGTTNDGDGRLYQSSNDSAGLRPLSNRDIKFNVRVAKFTSNSASIDLVHNNYEFFSVSDMLSNPKFRGGETIYQPYGNTLSNTTFTLTGNTQTTLGNNIVIGVSTSYTTQYEIDDYILLVDRSNNQNQQVSQIFSISDANTMILTEGAAFTANCYHRKVPVAKIFYADYVKNEIICEESNASNNTFRFFENSVFYFTNSTNGSTFGGTSYSNTDVVRVSNGTINCIASITTNTTGGIVSLNISTPGAGFPNSSHSVITVLQSDLVTPSSGSGASLRTVVNSPLRGEVSKSTAFLASINNFAVSSIDPDISVINVASSFATSNIAFSNATYNIQSFRPAPFNEVYNVDGYQGFVASRSNEVRNTTNLYQNDRSGVVRINLNVNKADVINSPLFFAPYVSETSLDMFAFSNRVSSTTSNTSGEVGAGNTSAKHITKRINFANNSFAEDIRVYLNAYKPANTEILVYARIHNSNDSEPFDDKAWSKLELKDGNALLSGKGNKEDIKEYAYGFPAYPEVAFTANGTATADSVSNTVVLTSVDLTSELATNDLVRLYDPTFNATNYMVAPVASVNSTAVVLTSRVTDTNLKTRGLKIDKLAYRTAAFNNIQNDNVARYYTSSLVAVDTYNSLSIKIVMLADDTSNVPEIDDIRVIGVSA